MNDISIDTNPKKEFWLDKHYLRKFSKIRNAVLKIYKENKKAYGDLAYFTPHGSKHCQAIVNILHRLIPTKKINLLTMKERFYLLSSVWLHDLGMLPMVYKEMYNKDSRNNLNEIRKKHHKISEEYIVNYWSRLQIDEEDKELLGKLCKYHSRAENINECDKEFIVKNDKVRLRLLSSYLRLADALDITSSRMFSEAYAICLAYNIPEDAKLHWIKSKLVNGVDINPKEHKITIYFKEPILDESEPIIDSRQANEKLNSIIKLVTDDLRDELSTVINILTRYSISYFLDVESETTRVLVDRQILNDLRELVINFDIMNNPSATKLLEIILVTIFNILGYYFKKDEKGISPIKLEGIKESNSKDIKDKVQRFLISVEDNILTSRPCHYGLKNIIVKCQDICKDIDSVPLESSVYKIFKLYQSHQNSRNEIRKNAKKYFYENFSKAKEIPKINILLYGFSELTTKAITGLRDSFIKINYGDIENKIYNCQLEKEMSDFIRIFICDGQPKTQTSYNDRLVYHDGSQLALHLKRRGFTKLIIIPDLIAGNLIEAKLVDYIFLGANGIEKESIKHSAGHKAIIELAINHRHNNEKKLENIELAINHRHNGGKKPEIILVSSSEKVADSNINYKIPTDNENQFIQSEDVIIEHIPEFTAYRNQIWMCKDKQLLNTLHDEDIRFLNPREDVIELNKIDTIISDISYGSTDGLGDAIINRFFPKKDIIV